MRCIFRQPKTSSDDDDVLGAGAGVKLVSRERACAPAAQPPGQRLQQRTYFFAYCVAPLAIFSI